jgi:hypothetical protein
MSMRSVHSRRTVPTQRSAKALPRGACGGDLMTSMPTAAKHLIEHGGELRVAVAQQVPQRVCSLVEVHQQVPRLLGDPRAGGAGGHPDDVDPAGRQLHEEQDLDSSEEHRVHGEEITRQDGVGLAGQKLLPGRSRPSQCRVDAGLMLVNLTGYLVAGDEAVRAATAAVEVYRQLAAAHADDPSLRGV